VVLVAWAEIITQITALRRLPVAGGAIEDNGKDSTLEGRQPNSWASTGM
jgi:hypothetical protein